MKLWDKDISTEARILAFTTGKDPLYDIDLAPYDVLGSMAHVIMLSEVGLLPAEGAATLLKSLGRLYEKARAGQLSLEEGVEDIHSQVEMELTAELGDLGKRIHTGRSRNDQVMVDIKLFVRDALQEVAEAVQQLAQTLLRQAAKYKDVGMPGYTHMQVAMPSSFGLWLGAYAEALADDLSYLQGIYGVVNQNPLGSAAGFGSSFPVDRQRTTDLLGFAGMHLSSVNAQMNRGRTEWYVATGLAAIARSMAGLAMDSVLFMGQNFGFLKLPAELTTGSSIMPHKKNPDVLELIRAHCNRLSQLPASVGAVTTNLISGYHRDFQILKEILHPAIEELLDCIKMLEYSMARIEVNPSILDNDIYRYLYSVEEVNQKVQEGIPFRDAYKEVAAEIETGRYRPGREHSYSHVGSIGNPGIGSIEAKLKRSMEAFDFASSEKILEGMLTYFDPS